MRKISVIVPVYNENHNLTALYKELDHLRKLNKYDVEYIFVNDGSTDDSLSQLQLIANDSRNIKIINFTRNFGQTAAFDAGIKRHPVI